MAYTALADGFFPLLAESERKIRAVRRVSADDVRRTLQKNRLNEEDFALLLSPAAGENLEPLARRAERETLRQFGRARQLFAPLYLANYCTNKCVYCGFQAGLGIARAILGPDEIEKEAKALAATGLRRVLALTGDAPNRTGADYIAMGVGILARHFPSVGVEVQALTLEEYASVVRAGADSMTMFQETYNPELYARLHPAGPKRDFAFRLDGPHRAASAGMRGVTLGALLGLGDWRFDVFMLGMHGFWLQRKFPHLELAFSLPRIRPCEERDSGGEARGGNGTFTPVPVSDREFVQAMTALRCFLPHAGITLSTRESAFLRDRLLPLGVTKLSAGVCTSVGGYAAGERDRAVQFVIDDQRTVPEVVAALDDMGYQPVFADWLLPEGGGLPLAGALRHTLGNPGPDAPGVEARP